MRVAGSRDRPSSPTAGTPLADHSYGALSEHSCGALPEHSCGDCHQRVMVPVSADSRGPRERSRVRGGALPVSYRGGFLTGTASVAAEEQELQQNSLGSGRAEIYFGVDPSTRSPSGGHPRVQPRPGGAGPNSVATADPGIEIVVFGRDLDTDPGTGVTVGREGRPLPRRHDRTGQDRIGHRSLASAGDCSRVNATRRWGVGGVRGGGHPHGARPTLCRTVFEVAGDLSPGRRTASDGAMVFVSGPARTPDSRRIGSPLLERSHPGFMLISRSELGGFGSGRLHSRHTRHSRLRHVSAVAGVTVESSTST